MSEVERGGKPGDTAVQPAVGGGGGTGKKVAFWGAVILLVIAAQDPYGTPGDVVSWLFGGLGFVVLLVLVAAFVGWLTKGFR